MKNIYNILQKFSNEVWQFYQNSLKAVDNIVEILQPCPFKIWHLEYLDNIAE